MTPISAFLRESALKGHREATLQLRRKVLTGLQHHVGDLLCATSDDLIDWYARYAKKSVPTRHSYGQTVRSFYSWAMERELVRVDPSRTLPIPRRVQSKPRPMPISDLVECLRQAPDDRMRAWLTLGAFAGLRAGEIARLRREDVRDRESPLIVHVANGKGGHDRDVVVTPKVIDVLRPFLQQKGRLWDVVPATVTIYMSHYMESLGMPWTCHTLRHTYATGMLRVSGDLRMVQAMLGHASPVTTAGYAEPSYDAAVDAAAKYQSTVQDAA